MASSNVSNISPNKKEVKLVDLKWYSRADRPKTPKKSPRKYHLRNKKNQSRSSSPKKSAVDSKQKKINSFFAVSPKPKTKTNKNDNDTILKSPVKKINSFFTVSPKPKTKTNDITQETPVKKKPADLSCDDFYLSPSERLDSLMPKIEDILRARETEENFKKIHAIISESSKRFLEGLDNCTNDQSPPLSQNPSETPSPVVTFKNCKHLTIPQITRKFKKDSKFIDDIFYGRVPNERYEQFKNDTPLNNGTKNDLRVNDTNIAFTQDQLIHIISLFRERYDHGNIYKYSDFYFKVLLPEYCLKIYSDVYKMTPADALDYLKSVPVQDYKTV